MAKSKKTNTRKPRTTKRKKNTKTKIPPTIMIGGVFFIIIAIIIILIMNIKVNTLKKQNSIKEQVKKETITPNIVHQRIQKVLKSLNLSNEIIRSKDSNVYNDQFDMKYTIDINEPKRSKFKSLIIREMRQFKLNVSDSGNTVVLKKMGQHIQLIFIDKPSKTVIPPVVKPSNKPRISIILDDAGRDLVTLKKMISSPYPITIATIPFTRHDIETVSLIKKAGKTAFLHLPCEPKSYPKTNPGKGAIFLNTPPELIDITLQKMFTRLKVDGFNNHMGSALTESKKKMLQVLTAAKQYTNTFVDSRTSPETVGYDVCVSLDMKCGMNRKFIDNKNDPDYIKSRLDHSVEFAKKHGDIIIIGHLKPNTVKVLNQYLPSVKAKGVEIVSLKQVLN